MEMIMAALRRVFLKPKPIPWCEPGKWFLFRERNSRPLSGPVETLTIFSWSENDPIPQSWPALPPELAPPVRLEACDHGLLCLYHPETGHVYLWNPSLAHLKKLPSPPCFPVAAFRIGLGHVASTGDVKVVVISRSDRSPPLRYPWYEAESEMFTRTSRFSVYSLKADAWTTADAPFPPLLLPEDSPWIEFSSRNETLHHDRRQCPVVAQGALHWGLRFVTAPPEFPHTPSRLGTDNFAVVAFHLETETFRMMTPPLGARRGVVPLLACQVARAFGSVAILSQDLSLRRAQVWVMREYGVATSWDMCADVDIHSLTNSPKAELILCGVVADNYLVFASYTARGRLFWYDLADASLCFAHVDPKVGVLMAEYFPTSYALL